MNLFCADLFSEPMPTFSLLQHTAEMELTQLFSDNYSHFGRLRKITRCSEIGINSSNYRVETSKSSYILKSVSKPHDEVKTTVDLAVWLHQQGVAVPLIYANSGNQFLTVEKKNIFYLMEEIVGSFVSGEPEELPVIRRLFGSLLPLGDLPVYPVANLPLFPLLNENDLTTLHEFERKLDFAGDLLGIEEAKCMAPRWEEIKNLVTEHLADIKKKPLRAGLMHIDLHPHNILLSKIENRAVAVDLDSFQICAPDVAIGFATFKILRQMGVKACSLAQLRKIKEELLSFNNHTLSANRYLLLGRTEILRRIIIILRLSLAGNKAWNHVLPVHLRGLIEMEVML
jgi:Phosphotransferase enzyme family